MFWCNRCKIPVTNITKHQSLHHSIERMEFIPVTMLEVERRLLDIYRLTSPLSGLRRKVDELLSDVVATNTRVT